MCCCWHWCMHRMGPLREGGRRRGGAGEEGREGARVENNRYYTCVPKIRFFIMAALGTLKKTKNKTQYC